MSFILEHLFTIIPVLLGLLGGGFGMYKSKQANTAKKQAILSDTKAKKEEDARLIAEKTTDILIERQVTDEVTINEAKAEAKLDRTKFFN